MGDLYHIDLREVPRSLQDSIGMNGPFRAKFDLSAPGDALYLSLTHPIVEGLAAHVMESALGSHSEGIARRAGAIRTRAVSQRTSLLLVRFRYDLVTRYGEKEDSTLAEECRIIAFQGAPEMPQWLEQKYAEALLVVEPDANIFPEQAENFVRRVVDGISTLRQHLNEEAQRRADALLDAHRRLRSAARMRGISYRVEPKLPPDVLGIYVYLPVKEVSHV